MIAAPTRAELHTNSVAASARARLAAVAADAGRLAHELNNLLAVIGGHADSLEQAIATDGADRASLRAIQRAVVAAAATTQRVRRLGQDEPAQVRGVDLAAVVRRVQASIRRDYGQRLLVNLHLGSRPWSVSIDGRLIEEAVAAIAASASEAMPYGGTLTLRTMNVQMGRPPIGGMFVRPERFVRLEVTCPTTSPEALDVAGDRRSASLDAVCRAGGRVSVDGDGGTVVTWSLLLPSDGVELRVVPEPMTATAPVPTIVLYDRDDARRSLLAKILDRQGYAVRSAASADEAARLLDAQPADLLIADCTPAVFSETAAHGGLALARRGQRVLCMCERGDEAAVAFPFADGVETMTAPFTAGALVATVQALLGPTARRPWTQSRVLQHPGRVVPSALDAAGALLASDRDVRWEQRA